MPDLAVFFEHPAWFTRLFEELESRGLDVAPMQIQHHVFDPADLSPPAPVILNRLAMSSFLRQEEHALFYSLAALAHWEGLGARVINGPKPLAYDLSKARQLSLFGLCGLKTPRTMIAHRLEDLPRLGRQVGYPLMIKVNIGGSGAGMARYDDEASLRAAILDGSVPKSVDGVTLVQDYVPAADGRVIRCEILDGRLLYAIALDGAGSTFDLCPADVCMVDKPTISISAFFPPADIVAAVERVARAADLDVGGVEYIVDERDGSPRFYDLNALSNFVAKPLEVLGFDPHVPFVDWIVAQVETKRRAAA